MLSSVRHERILDRLRSAGPTEVAVLSGLLRVSEATVRRDLAHLESEGALTRVHGGAALTTTPEPPFAQVSTSHLDEKTAVARSAAALVEDGDVVLLDIGTTTHQLAVELRGRSITVVTSSLAVLEVFERDTATELIVLGGVLRRNYRSLVGFITEQALRQIHVDKLFLGTSGIRADGSVLDTTVVEVPVKQGMIAAADHVTLLADSDKFPGSGVARVCGPESINALVTTTGADKTTLAALREAGCDVLTAEAVPNN
jgi:DeoR/GlpR family transcriptional regulator of sugar metabolism